MALGKFLDKLKGVVAPIAKVAAPIVGTAIGGPLGGVLAGGLVGGLTSEDKLKGALMGAGTTAAGMGAAKALGAGAQAATDTATTATQAATAAPVAQAATAAPAAAAGGFGQIDPVMAAKTAFAPSAAAPAVQGTFNPALTQAAASGAVPTTPPELFAAPPDLSQPSLPSIASEVNAGQMIAPEGYVPMEQRMFSPDPGGVSMGEGGNLVGNASFGQTGRESALAGPREGLDFRIAEKSPQGRLMSALTGVGKWAQENPELALGIASAAEGIFTTSPEELAAQRYENEIARRSAIRELLLDSGISF